MQIYGYPNSYTNILHRGTHRESLIVLHSPISIMVIQSMTITSLQKLACK